MRTRLEEAFAEAAALPDKEQDALGEWLRHELASKREWQALFAKSQDVLEMLADEALGEYRRGETLPLDPETM